MGVSSTVGRAVRLLALWNGGVWMTDWGNDCRVKLANDVTYKR